MNNLLRISLNWVIVICVALNITNAQVICSEPPENDFCGDAFEIDGSLLGLTCCGEIEGFNLCGDLETGVWYYYNQNLSATLIEIENISIAGGIGVEIYAGACGSLTLLAQSDCTGFENRDFTVPNCNGRIYIHISTKSDGCGEFVVTMTDVPGCDLADTCEEIVAEQQMAPISDGLAVCATSCLEYSCVSTCTDQSAWFQVNTDQFATNISIVIDNAEFLPNISVYRGSSCSDLDDLFLCEVVTPGSYTDVAVAPSSSYFIEVSLEGGDPGAFDICVNASQDFINCSEGTITVIRPENPMALPQAPICPGETVTICYELDFFVDIVGQGNNCQWLQGIVPVLGGGWDRTVNLLEDQPIDNGWEWFDDVHYNVDSPVLGLANDQEGNLILDFGVGGLQMGDVLPGGWWYSSPAVSSTGCVQDGHPDNSWGLESLCNTSVIINHCFDLTTKTLDEVSDCEDDYSKDLSITMFIFADGETGCYDGQLACAGDTPLKFESRIDCSTLVEYDLVDDEICSGDFASIPVGIIGGYEVPIMVEVIDAGNTTGAQDWIFETGSGLIPDQIINNGSNIETITYQVSFYESESTCDSPVETFEVRVHPEFNIVPPASFNLCVGDSQVVSAPSGHDAYAWYNAQTNVLLSDQIDFEISEAGFYRLEVTEDFCTAKEIFEVNLVTPLLPALDVNAITLCNNFIGTLPTAVDLSALQLNGITGDWMDDDDNMVADPSNVDFDGSTAGIYEYKFITNSAISPCPDTTYIVEIDIENCVCPSTEIIAPANQCNVDSQISLSGLLITSEPGFWTITDGEDISSINISGDNLIISDVSEPGDYTIQYTITTSDIGPLCETTSDVSFTINEEPTADLILFGTACNEDTGTDPDFIDLDDFNPNNVSGSWSTLESGITIESDNVVDFAGEDVKDYIFTFTTDFASAPCLDQSYPLTITLQDCSCPSVAIGTLDDLCLEPTTIDLTTVKLTTEDGFWTITDGPSVGSLNIDNDNLEVLNSTLPGIYEITFNLTDTDIGPDCPLTSNFSFEIFEEPSATITPIGQACNEDTGTDPDFLDLDDFNPNGASGFWSTLELGIVIDSDNIVDFKDREVKDYIFTFTTNTASAPCLDQSYPLTITVNDCKCPSVEIGALDNICLEPTIIDLTTIKITTEDGFWSVTDGPNVGSINV
ncbi:MAG: hypothetical protein HKO66_02525, partial [Saprospiraceae bacterium]|nr:hypothetical protein [Saprospiraceae bacterium]